MATKYAGQNALNKLMQIIKAAIDAKADKSALDGKLDKTGGTMTGDLTVSGAYITAKSSDGSGGDVKADRAVSAYNFIIDTGVGDKMAIFKTGDTAAAIRSTPGANYIRFAVGAPSGGNDATTKDYVDNKVSGLQTADQVRAAISSAITGVYTPKGSIAFKSLPTAAAGNKGWVYNVTDAFTTTAAFVEGAGHSYGAGTNVVCVDAGSGSYKWDVLAGTIDLTELTATEVQKLWDSI
nr:MAG TPA_asm: hypothetical protein [Caudoviricetes sp.]